MYNIIYYINISINLLFIKYILYDRKKYWAAWSYEISDMNNICNNEMISN